MVAQEDSEKRMEEAINRKPLSDQKSYIIVENHVKELSNTTQNTTYTGFSQENSRVGLKRKATTTRKKFKKQKKIQEKPTTSSDSDNNNPNAIIEIDSSDLNELKTLYTKCKEVMQKIESKYGHILNLNSKEGPSGCLMKETVHSESNEDKCHCKTKKKIVFDDEGRQSLVDVSGNHVCVRNTNYVSTAPSHRNIAVEYEDPELGLPETIRELRELLKDPDIETTYRNRIFEKIRTLRTEYNNEIKFNKPNLIEQLKTNPDDLLNFKGTNLSSMLGYP